MRESTALPRAPHPRAVINPSFTVYGERGVFAMCETDSTRMILLAPAFSALILRVADDDRRRRLLPAGHH